jgi:arabinoxylan arabinofuranohydrolase
VLIYVITGDFESDFIVPSAFSEIFHVGFWQKTNKMTRLFFTLFLLCFNGFYIKLNAQSKLPIAAHIADQGNSKPSNHRTKGNYRMLNPICPPGVYIADPEVRQMPDGRVYLYGSRDEPGNTWCSTSYNVLSTSDLVTWNLDQTSFATAGIGKQTDYTNNILYAPDCIQHNGKYYLYYCLAADEKNEGVAIASSPYGPFRNGKVIERAEGIDPSVFIDDDGQGYLFWGQSHARGAKLSKDMQSIEGEIRDNILTYKEHGFNEASSVRKHNGIYYYIYGGHQRHGESNCATLNYATASAPLGPYTYRGVIIDNWGSGKNLVNNHGCITEIDGRWYIFYHRPTHGTSSLRKACMEPIVFNADGTIDEVEMTTQGAGGAIDPYQRMDASRACLMSGNMMVTVRRPANDIPVEYLSSIRDGDYAYWKYFDFSQKGVTRFTCKTWGDNLAGSIEIHLDKPNGKLIGICNIEPMHGEVAYSIHSATLAPLTGVHAVVLVFKSKNVGEKNTNLMNLDWFMFAHI